MVNNILGQVVATLADREEFDPGRNEIEFDASSFASSVYIYRLLVEPVLDKEAGSTEVRLAVQKMLLVK